MRNEQSRVYIYIEMNILRVYIFKMHEDKYHGSIPGETVYQESLP